jgi:hypothetical protein
MVPSLSSTVRSGTQQSQWNARADRLFDVGSLALLAIAFCLYLWAGVGIVPLALLAAARVAIGQSRPRPTSLGGDAHPRALPAPPRRRRYRYVALATAFAFGAALGGVLGWNELAYAVLAAGTFGAGTAPWRRRFGGHQSHGRP